MTWVEHHRRSQVLAAVAELADRRRDGLLPWGEIADVGDAFSTPADLLAALQLRWYTHLAGSIETALADQPADLEAMVVHAWRYAAAALPGIRAILDANLEHEAIASGRRKELALLATASGRAGLGDPRADMHGRKVEQRARGISVETASLGAA